MSPRRPRLATAFLLIALAIGETGCAMIMQQPPKENRAPGEVPVCSTGRGGVALDGILAALLGAGALAALAGDEPGAALGLGAVGGVYTFSAVTGHRSASACEEALEDHKLEVAARRPEPAPAPRPAGVARPLGPPIERAAAPVDQQPAPPVEAEPAPPAEPQPPPAAPPEPAAQDDWSDFWVEVAK